ncbi:hypothetical protein, partial [Neptuniibacter sp.]|uniref:hypothetical protein n=1 Tax=Neptuniibacter sp. TaxID=1962643 RepID=UPI00261447F3
MKISAITRIASAVLALIVALLAVAIFWSLERLDTAFKMKDNYHGYIEELYLNLEKPVTIYLMTGNATVLTTIEKNIDHLASGTQQKLPTEIQQDVLAQLKEIKTRTLTELRAAGKLAQPEVLLIHNERELNDAISSVKEYADKANFDQAELKSSYLNLLMEVQMNTLSLSHNRQSYFKTGQEESIQQIEFILQRLQQEAEELNKLERLGIYKEQEEDDLSALLGIAAEEESSEQEEIGDEPLATIKDLVNRYPKELENARKFSQQKKSSSVKAQQDVENLEHAVSDISTMISERYQEIRYSVYVMMAVCIALIIATGISMNYLLRKLGQILIQTTAYIDQLSHGQFSGNINISSRLSEVQTLHLS